jgi:hypothetical protein
MTEHVRIAVRALAVAAFATSLVPVGSRVSAASTKPAAAAPAARPTIAPPKLTPCDPSAAVPAPISSRWTQLGGARTLGCYDHTAGNLYVFKTGQIIDMSASYRSGASLAAVLDAQQLIHLYWQAPNMNSYANPHWLVRLTYDGAEINQQSYAPGDHPYSVGSVQEKYGEDVIVHPGGRHGAVQVAVEACGGGGLISSASVCVGWAPGTLTFEL